ncbi:pre T-cell antigen receptor alpha [Struthio camelus]|uniref:pre T-cell antigen receptor alpha n=1 Tax=Struthio camelus TaxID=8801 RepID=UPI003603C9C6
MGPARLLPLAALLQLQLQLLPPRGAAGPLPALAPPLTLVAKGQRRQLVACVVSDLPPGSRDAVWISGGDGSALRALAEGASRGGDGDGGTASTVSVLPADSEALACHVGPDRTAPARSSEPVRVAGDAAAPPCPGAPAGPRACAAAALLVAVRLLLLKVLLFDALLTSMALAGAGGGLEGQGPPPALGAA